MQWKVLLTETPKSFDMVTPIGTALNYCTSTIIYQKCIMICAPDYTDTQPRSQATHSFFNRYSLGSSDSDRVSPSLLRPYGAEVVWARGWWWWTCGRFTGSSSEAPDWTTFRCSCREESSSSDDFTSADSAVFGCVCCCCCDAAWPSSLEDCAFVCWASAWAWIWACACKITTSTVIWCVWV